VDADLAEHIINWVEPTFEAQAAAAQALSLLRRGLEAKPDNPRLLARLAGVQLDRYDFAAAAESFERLRKIEPQNATVLSGLARCLNEFGRAADALVVLDAAPGCSAATTFYHRAVALESLGRVDEAEADFRAALDIAPGDHHACAGLMRLMRKAGRPAEALEICETLFAKGVRHTQLLLDWGDALAAAGAARRASALMFDPARLGRFELAAPAPFDDAAGFCAAFADELICHPITLERLPTGDANRGSRRVHQLLGGGRPQLVRTLAASLQSLIDRFVAALRPLYATDPWLEARPRRARLNCWGLIQRPGEFEAWHSHPGGWLSGVCYLRLPATFSADGDGDGCIEFGPPPALLNAGLAPCVPMRVAPHEGLVLLAPSHYLHRTIPFATEGERVSLAFDVIPDALA
jgi:tetratricopeptide (TPR) repeat protein